MILPRNNSKFAKKCYKTKENTKTNQFLMKLYYPSNRSSLVSLKCLIEDLQNDNDKAEALRNHKNLNREKLYV